MPTFIMMMGTVSISLIALADPVSDRFSGKTAENIARNLRIAGIAAMALAAVIAALYIF